MHRRKIRNYLNKSLPIDETVRQELSKEMGVTELAAVSIPLFDVLYNTSLMDPSCLEGMNHLHHAQNFKSLGELRNFFKENIITSSEGSSEWGRMVHKYKGYTGEQQAKSILEESGCVVEMAPSGTEEGYDMIVQGDIVSGPVNVKITNNDQYIRNFLDDNPGIKVVTNEEMAEHFSDNSDVIALEGLSEVDAYERTSETIGGINDLGSCIHRIPYITLGISSVKNISGVVKGRKSMGDALEHIVEDTAGVGLGSLVGGKVGLSVGLALAPVTGGTSAIIIPAATTLVGTMMGVLKGKQLFGWIKKRHLRKAIEKLRLAAADFGQEFKRKRRKLVKSIKAPYKCEIKKYQAAFIQSDVWYRRIFYPKVMSEFYTLARKKVSQEMKRHCSYYKELMRTIKGNDESQAGLIIFSQGAHILCEEPALIEKWNAVKQIITEVEREKARIR